MTKKMTKGQDKRIADLHWAGGEKCPEVQHFKFVVTLNSEKLSSKEEILNQLIDFADW
jgi:hypothetical protein